MHGFTARLTLLIAAAAALAAPAAAAADAPQVLGPFAAAPHRASRAPIPRTRSIHPSAVARQKQQAQSVFANPTAPPELQTPSRQAVVSGSLNQPGLKATDYAANAGTPPDPTGAVGPNNYVEFVNSTIRVYKKTDLSASGILSTANADSFVGQSGDNVFDIQIQYDPQAGRWFFLTDDCSATLPATGDCSTSNYLAFGFSKTNDPSDLVNGWCRYRVASATGGVTTTDYFDDYPKLGHDDNHLIFGTNVFNTTGFVSARIWTVDKTALVPGSGGSCPASPAVHYFSGSASSPTEDGNLASKPLRDSANAVIGTPEPANTMDASAVGYVVAAEDPPSTRIMAWHVGGTGASPVLTADGDITVSSFSMPANVPQPGSSNVLDSSDTRLTQAVALTDPNVGGEAVWTQHTVNGGGGRSVVRWYELIPSSVSEHQEGTISNSSNWVFNGAIAPTLQGNEAVIEYNVGGSSQLVQVRASSHAATQTLGQMSGEVTLATSTDVDEDFSCPSVDPTSPSCRWGDYAGASTDPSVQHTVWGTNQWNDTAAGANDAQWATQNFALIVNPVPTAAFSASPNPALTGQAVDFDASASSDTQGGGIASYGWDFGDGSTAAGVTAQHAYAAPGNYAVTLTVTDADGYSASVAHTVTVNAPAPPPPPPPTGTTTSSSPAPSPSPVTSPSGTTSPGLANLTLAVKSPRTIRAVLVARKGIAGAVQCSAACRATVVLVLPAKVAKHFHLRGKIGSASVRGGAGVRKGFRLRLTRSARRVLAGRAFAAYLKRHRVRATLRTVATGSGGRSVTVRKALTLRR